MENTELTENNDIKETEINLDENALEKEQNSLVKEFFVKEGGDSVKELSQLFGQSESELTKEFGSYKAKKILKRISCYIDISTKYRDGIVKELQSILKRGFYGVTLYSNVLPIAKNVLKGSDVKIRVLVNYPHGEETYKTTKYAVKQAVKTGADQIAIMLSPYEIKNGELKEVIKKLKKLIKKAKKKQMIVILNVEKLTLAEIETTIRQLSDLKLYAITLSGEVDKARISEVISACNVKTSIECFSSVCVAEQAISLLLSGVNVLTTDNYNEVVDDLNKKISGITGCDGQLLDKSCDKD